MAVILVVEPVAPTNGSRPPRLVLGNIHVLFNPKRGEAVAGRKALGEGLVELHCFAVKGACTNPRLFADRQ